MANPDRATEIGKRLADAFKKAKPHAERLAAAVKPRAEKASKDALKLARDHEGELKQVAQKLVRARITGPLGLVVDAFSSTTKNPPPCKNCQAANPINAKFCNQCGASLEDR